MTEIDTASVTPATQVPIGEATKQIDEELRALIVKALAVKTRSYSSFGGKETGNAYQAVRLRDEVLAGFRVSDEEVWAGLGVEGRTVIDLGCNLGERTRLAVRAGASFAEGIEYEDLFVRIGGLINVYNRMHNILLRQGDVTKPGCLEESYDIVACFSAFVYVRENLEEIPWIPERSATASSEADLDVFSKFGEDDLERCLEAEAFTGREIGGEDDLLDVLIGDLVDIEVTRQPSS